MKELEFNKRYTWKEVVEAYPGKWVRMSQCTLSEGAGIIDGILVSIHNDEEYGHTKIMLLDAGSDDELRRTTSEMSVGIITCWNARMEVDTDDEP